MSINSLILDKDTGFKSYVDKVMKIPMLSEPKERDLAIRLAEHGDIAAAHKLVTSHLKLVVTIASKFKNYGLPMMDIVSEGNIGLMKAVKKFDVNKGFRLSTYAMWWIKAQIQEYILKSWSLVKICTTVAQKKLFFNLNKIKNKILKYDQGAISDADYQQVSESLGVSISDVKIVDQRLSQGDVYLYDKMSNDAEADEIIDILPDTADIQDKILEDKQSAESRQHMLYAAIKTLNDREKNIIALRKLTDSPKTLEDLSKEYGVSKERVRQIEARALEKIKEYFVEFNQ